MIEETGLVVAIEDDACAWVETQRKAACDSCSVNKGCGTSVLAKAFGQRGNRVKALNPIAAEVNDHVVLGLEEQALVSGSFAVYIVPIAAMIVMALVGQAVAAELKLASEDGLVALFGFGGLGLGFVWLNRYSRKVAKDSRYQPVILRTVAKSDPVVCDKS